MSLPTLEEVQKAIHAGFNKRYQETIKDSFIEAVYDEIIKLATKKEE
jgi:hypothetical protein